MPEKKFQYLILTVFAPKLNFDNKDCRKCEENDKIYTESFSSVTGNLVHAN